MWRQRLTRRFSQKFRNIEKIKEIREKFDENSQKSENVEQSKPLQSDVSQRETEVLNTHQRHLTRREDVHGEELRKLIRKGQSFHCSTMVASKKD